MDRITNTTNTLAFELTNNDLKFTNMIEFAFELKSYNSSMPIYAIILDFMFETGGIY